METIYIASDHAGFEIKEKIKEFLEKEGFKFVDLGPYEYNPYDDYPDYALKVCKMISEKRGKGILVCGSGQGMCIVANKIPGIRAALAWDEVSAKLAREHLDANVLCLPGRMLNKETAERMVEVWLKTPFSNEERHKRRLRKIKEIEGIYERKGF